MPATTSVPYRAAAICALLSISLNASADEFRWQFTGSAQELESGVTADFTSEALSATYYLEPVDDEAGPLALAPFLNRSSRVTGSFFQREEERGTFFRRLGFSANTILPAESTDGYSISGRYVWQESGWYLGGGISVVETDIPPSIVVSQQIETDRLDLVFGKYLTGSTTLELRLRESETNSEISGGVCDPGATCFVPVSSKLEIDDVVVSVRHVGEVFGMTYSVSGMAQDSSADFSVVTPPVTPSFVFNSNILRPNVSQVVAPSSIASTLGDARIYTIAGELYPTNRLGFRLGLGDIDEGIEQDQYSISATWFFTSRIAAEISRTTSKPRGEFSAVPDTDLTFIRVIGRL